MMTAASSLRYARKKASLSQRELARRAGTTQATISRIEEGVISPRLDTLERLLAACGFQLEATPLRGDGIARSAIIEALRATSTDPARRATREARNLEKLRASRSHR